MHVRKGAKRRRTGGRQLLVAAAGVASISYVGSLGGCAAQADPPEPHGDQMKNSEAWDDDGGVAQAEQKALPTVGTATSFKPVQPVGNLMPGPGVDVHWELDEVIRVPVPVGNLMATPIDQLQIDDVRVLEQAVKGTR